MKAQEITYFVSLVALVMLAYWFGCWRGALRQRGQWADHMAKCNRYADAVEELDRWCGHASPHARLIARHLRAHGEGLGYNAGTPSGDEACNVSGLRQQLRHIDRAALKGEQPAQPSGSERGEV